MKKILIIILVAFGYVAQGQTVGQFRYDTVKILKVGGSSELKVLNRTRDSLGGIATNVGGGWMEYIKPRAVPGGIIIGLDTITFSTDTIHVRAPLYLDTVSSQIFLNADTTDATPTALATQYDLAQIALSVTNIYNADGTLTGTRDVILDGHQLTFWHNNTSGDKAIQFDGNSVAIFSSGNGSSITLANDSTQIGLNNLSSGDTTIYKPMGRSTSGGLVQMTHWPSGAAGATPGIDAVLAADPDLTTNRYIDLGGFNFQLKFGADRFLDFDLPNEIWSIGDLDNTGSGVKLVLDNVTSRATITADTFRTNALTQINNSGNGGIIEITNDANGQNFGALNQTFGGSTNLATSAIDSTASMYIHAGSATDIYVHVSDDSSRIDMGSPNDGGRFLITNDDTRARIFARSAGTGVSRLWFPTNTAIGSNHWDNYIPKASGVFVVSVAGQVADSAGAVTGIAPTATPVFTTNITTPLVLGGTSTTQTLILQPTSGVGTTGSNIIFKVGNNGAVTAATIDHLGAWNFGNNAITTGGNGSFFQGVFSGGTRSLTATVGTGSLTPATGSIVDIASTTKGLLIPRMTTAQRDAIGTPTTGLSVYNTTTNTDNFYNGTQWATTTPLSGSFSQVGAATTVFTVTIGTTQPNATYKVNVTPTAALSAALFYVTNKTTTTFDVTFLAGITGTVTFDWSLLN